MLIQVRVGPSSKDSYTIRGAFSTRFILTSIQNRITVIMTTGPQIKFSGFRAAYIESRKRPWSLYYIP